MGSKRGSRITWNFIRIPANTPLAPVHFFELSMSANSTETLERKAATSGIVLASADLRLQEIAISTATGRRLHCLLPMICSISDDPIFRRYSAILFIQGILIEQPANNAGAGRYSHFDHNQTQERLDRVGGYVHTLSNLFAGQPHRHTNQRLLLAFRKVIFGSGLTYGINDGQFPFEVEGKHGLNGIR